MSLGYTEVSQEVVVAHRPIAPTPEPRWMVMWTKPRQEKCVARQLDAWDAEFFMPLIPRVTLTRGRRRLSQVPLFPGYVFLRGSLDDSYRAIETKRICQLIHIADQDRFVLELDQIREAIARGGAIEQYSFAVTGRRCRVVRGPFLGLEGVITRRLGQHRLILQLAILGQGAALEIDIEALEPID